MGYQPEELVLHGVRRIQCLSSAAALRDVDEDIDRADQCPVRIEDDRWIRDERRSRPVWSQGDRLVPTYGPRLVERDRHRALLVAHRPAVGPVELPRSTPFFPELRSPTPQVRGRLVEERDVTLGVGRVDRDPDRVEELAIARAFDRWRVEQ